MSKPDAAVGSGRRGVEGREIKDLKDNVVEAVIDTSVLFIIYVVVIMGRAVTNPKALAIFRRGEVYVWAMLWVMISAFVKTFFPRLDDQLMNASTFNVIGSLMSPIRV